MRVSPLLALALLTLTVSGCRESAAPSDPAAERAADSRRIIVEWMECTECEHGELDRVVALGPDVIPSLRATLLQGPSNASKERMRLHLVDAHRKLVEYWRTHPPAAARPASQDEYVDTFMSNYQARYQAQAATALKSIGGPDARKALEESLALQPPLRDDVLRTVNESLAQLANRPAAR